MSENIIKEFPVMLYGNLEKYNETISKGRCRIFYKGANRNGTFITDEFAEKLLSTIPYTPVKGIYEVEEDDYTDHGVKRSEGRIYGIVPENPNFVWEKHLDEDGVEREYACVDVLIFTALYTEANDVIGKAQSMELYPKSIKGSWKIIEGKRFYVFDEACFLGLQVLGDDVEPCFEGAAFYSLCVELKEMLKQAEQYSLNLHNGGNNRMLNYKLSDRQKFDAIWSLLNVNYCEAGGWTINFDICEIYDEYAVVRNYEEGIFERIYYSKNDETDSLKITGREQCYFLDVTEAEKKALDALHGLNNNTYEKIDENYSAAVAEVETKTEELNTLTETYNTLTETYNTEKGQYEEKISEFETKIEELNNSISTLNVEKEEAFSASVALQSTIDGLNEEVATLNSFKDSVEKKEKENIIAKYSEHLSEEIISKYTETLDNYTIKELDKELAYELVSTNQTVFTNNQGSYIPKDEPVSGLEELLTKYKK